MTEHDVHASAETSTRRWAVVATVLGIGAVVLIAFGVAGRQHTATDAPSYSGPWFHVAPRQHVAPRKEATAPPPASPPVRLRISAIGVSTSVVRLGLNKDRTVQVPKNPNQAGWYRLGASPGQIGSAVMLGHVDSTEGPAVFYRLRTLTQGDRADVVLADGSVLRFRVSRVATYQNKDFPRKKVYGNHGSPTLTLITCGGNYDRAAGGYQANVVVFTKLIRSAPTPDEGHARTRSPRALRRTTTAAARTPSAG